MHACLCKSLACMLAFANASFNGVWFVSIYAIQFLNNALICYIYAYVMYYIYIFYYIYIYIYIYIYNYRRYRFGLLGLISVVLMSRMKVTSINSYL